MKCYLVIIKYTGQVEGSKGAVVIPFHAQILTKFTCHVHLKQQNSWITCLFQLFSRLTVKFLPYFHASRSYFCPFHVSRINPLLPSSLRVLAEKMAKWQICKTVYPIQILYIFRYYKTAIWLAFLVLGFFVRLINTKVIFYFNITCNATIW